VEFRELLKDVDEYFRNGWNVLDILGLSLAAGAFIVRCIDSEEPWGRALYALSAPFFCSRILFFGQVLQFQGPMIRVRHLSEQYQILVLLLFPPCAFALSSQFGATVLNGTEYVWRIGALAVPSVCLIQDDFHTSLKLGSRRCSKTFSVHDLGERS